MVKITLAAQINYVIIIYYFLLKMHSINYGRSYKNKNLILVKKVYLA